MNRNLLKDPTILATKEQSGKVREEISSDDELAPELVKINPNEIVLKEADTKPDMKPRLLQIKQEKEVTMAEVRAGEGYGNEVMAELT